MNLASWIIVFSKVAHDSIQELYVAPIYCFWSQAYICHHHKYIALIS